jgi:hypothetical protein
MHDSFLALRGQVTTRVIDAASGRTLRVHVGPNSISYVSTLIVMDLFAQTDLGEAPLSIGATHPADVSRGFVATTNVTGNAAYNAIRYMQVGLSVTPSQRADQALVTPLAGDAGYAYIANISFPANNTMRFVANYGTGDANGYTLGEVALYTRGDSPVATTPVTGAVASVPRMISRRATNPTPKDATIQLEYTWTISFA